MEDNTISGTILFLRTARFEEFARFKLHLTKWVTTCTGERIQVNLRKGRCKYWLYHCEACGDDGVVRADYADRFRCKCRRSKQKEKRCRKKKIQPDTKICPCCTYTLPLTTEYFYKSKKGYFGSYCKPCHRGRYMPDKDFGGFI